MICKKVLIPILLFLIGTGCKDKVIDPGQDNLFYPLKINNTWEYKDKLYDSLGVLEYEGIFVEKIIADTFLNYQLMYEIESPLYKDPACCDYKFYFISKYDGLHLLIKWAEGNINIYNNLIYKFPTAQDDFFISTNRNQDTTFVISLQDTIITEAGTFICIVFKNKIKDYTTEESLLGYVYTYVAYGVGKIKQEKFLFNSKQHLLKYYEYELKNYTLY